MNELAVKEMEKAIALDPNNQGFRSINLTYLYAGEFEKSYEIGKRFQESAFILVIQGHALYRLGREDEALSYLKRGSSIAPGKMEAIAASSVISLLEGSIEDGLAAARQFEENEVTDPEAWYFNAGNYGLLGDKEGCLRCLRQAVDRGFFNYPLFASDTYLDAVRDQPEFKKILDEARIKHEAFKKSVFN